MSGVLVSQLGVRAGKTTLIDDVSLEVSEGTWCTVVGPNGAGKTTLVETVAGIRRPSSGTVVIDGKNVADLAERDRARLVALVPQHPVVPAGMSVRDYVALGRFAYHGLLHAPSAKDRQVVSDVVARLDLEDLASRDVVTLSGGERQRMVLARALVQSTPVIVLDEPISGLDLRHQMTMLELLQQEVRECGLCVIATLHDLTLAGQFADRLVLLDHGRVIIDGPSRDVVRSEQLATCYGMALRVVDVDGADVIIPVRHASFT